MNVSQLVFEDPDCDHRIELSVQAMNHMVRLCEADPSRETGGILIGFYSDDCVTAEVVEAAGPPADSERGRNWFHRGIDGLERLLRSKWNKRPRLHYLGEWHFHTSRVPLPSPQDQKQMAEVAQDSRYDCKLPILVIVSPTRTKEKIVKCFVCPDTNTLKELEQVHDEPQRDRDSGKTQPAELADPDEK